MASPRSISATNASFFTPVQNPPAGTALSENPPTLFTPISLRGLTFQNRIWVAPMCTYSADNGHLTPFHLVHLSAFAYRGASLTIIEATAVQPRGRISPECPGLWQDSQIAPIKQISDFIHSQGQKIGIQLAHAGRKASMVAPWLAEKIAGRGKGVLADETANGWPGDVKAMSAITWGDGYAKPSAFTIEEIQETIKDFGRSARRAVEAGIDTIEIHAAHGYLLHSTLSPVSNRRTDSYGGSWDNRTRMLIEVIREIRSIIPKEMPLLLRISTTEWLADHPDAKIGTWDIEDSIKLAKMLPGLGVDLLDCSSGGNHPDQKIQMHNDFQVGIAGRIREALRKDGITDLAIGCVGMITHAEFARQAVEDTPKMESQARDATAAEPTINSSAADDAALASDTIEVKDETGIAKADIVLIARQFLREPEWVLRVAYRLGVKVQWPQQYHRGQFLKGSRI